MGYQEFFRNFDDNPDFQQKSRGDRNMNNTVVFTEGAIFILRKGVLRLF